MSGQLVLLHSFDGLSIQFHSDEKDVVSIVREESLVLRREAGLPHLHATEMSLGNKIKPRTYSVFAACLRTATGTDPGVICPSGLQCFYSPSRLRGMWAEAIERIFLWFNLYSLRNK